MNLPEMLGRGLVLHRAGHLADAAAVYNSILETDPAFFDAIHLLGVLEAQRGRYGEAERLVGAAIKVEPRSAAARSNLGNILNELGRFDEALVSYEASLAIAPDDAQTLNNRGNALAHLKRPGEALVSYDAALLLQPGFVEAMNNRGNALLALQRPDAALASYDRALTISPDYPNALNNRGNALLELKRLDEALVAYDKVLAVKPDHDQALYNRGNALLGLRRPTDALRYYDRALAVRADSAGAWNNRANALLALKRPAEAISCCSRAIAISPVHDGALQNLGNALLGLARSKAALTHIGRALAVDPLLAEARNKYGDALLDLERASEALANYSKALAIKPDFVEALSSRGTSLRRLGDLNAASPNYDRALAISPDYVEALYNRGLTFQDLRSPDEALTDYRRALAIKPDFTDALNNRAVVLQSTGRGKEALKALERAVAVAPSHEKAARNRLSAYLYTDRVASPDFARRAVAFVRQHRAAETMPPPPNDRNLDRPLRVGFLSSDFRSHPVANNMRAIFEHRDRGAFTYICYAHETASDDTTVWYRGVVDAWRNIAKSSNRDVAELIRRDRIDILVILAGYFDQNRPLVATYRPAPVQVSMADGATSGIPEMDYFVGDPILTPEDGTEQFVESVVRLPVFMNHGPHAFAPIANRDGSRGKAIVFGSFNNPAKLSDSLLRLWAEVLRRVPQSRLVLKYRTFFARNDVRRPIMAILAEGGIAAYRVEFAAAGETEAAHLSRYNDVDIALDSHPFSGATTSFEALWMGVPVVTLCYGGFISRMTAAHLIPLGLSQCVASTPAEYVERAVDLAGRPHQLRNLRSTLRDRLLGSALMDGPGYARNVETMFKDLWCRWAKARRDSN